MLLLIGPLIFRYIAVRTTRGESHQRSIGIMLRWAAIFMVGMITVLIANRFLDTATAKEIHVTVVAKHSHAGLGEDYTLLVGPS